MIAAVEREFRLAARYNPRYLHELNDLTLHFALPDQEATEGEGDEQKLTYGLFCMNVANALGTTDTTVGNLSLAYARLGLYCLNRSDLESSLHMFEMMDQTGVQHPEFLNEYGVALGMCGRLEEARNVFERALELLPGDPTILGNLRNATNETVSDLKMLQPLIEFTAPFFQQDSYPPHIAA